MFVDETGALWIANPWVAIVMVLGVVGLVVWCHRWLESGQAPLPRARASRSVGRVERPRMLRRRLATRRSAARLAVSSFQAGPTVLARGSNSMPRNAA
jgi:hypothetical protein